MTASLAIITAGSENSAIFAAAFSASSISSAAGTTRETRPQRSASAASIMRPVRTMSMALDLPTKARQPLRPAHARHDAERDFGLAEFRVVGSDDEIAHHGEFAAAAKRVAGDGGDDRLANAGKFFPADEEILKICFDIGLGLHFLDVGAGGESLFRAGEDRWRRCRDWFRTPSSPR